MKSVGEAMAIGRTKESMQKALRSLEISAKGLVGPKFQKKIEDMQSVQKVFPDRLLKESFGYAMAFKMD